MFIITSTQVKFFSATHKAPKAIKNYYTTPGDTIRTSALGPGDGNLFIA